MKKSATALSPQRQGIITKPEAPHTKATGIAVKYESNIRPFMAVAVRIGSCDLLKCRTSVLNAKTHKQARRTLPEAPKIEHRTLREMVKIQPQGLLHPPSLNRILNPFNPNPKLYPNII